MTETGARLRAAEILLFEDNDDDAELTRIGFAQAKLAVHMHQVSNGEECMAFLRREGRFADAPRPDLVLLDLNMPRMDGREVLAELSADEALPQLPVVVMTTSLAERDVLDAYSLRCSSYVVKPVDFNQFSDVIKAIANYWFQLVVLPTDMEKGNGR